MMMMKGRKKGWIWFAIVVVSVLLLLLLTCWWWWWEFREIVFLPFFLLNCENLFFRIWTNCVVLVLLKLFLFLRPCTMVSSFNTIQHSLFQFPTHHIIFSLLIQPLQWFFHSTAYPTTFYFLFLFNFIFLFL